MDSTVLQTNPESRQDTSCGISFAAFIAVAALFIALGMKYSQSSGIIQDLSFYGRYDGIGQSITDHFITAVKCSAACLAELLILYFLSFSPLLVPAVLILAGLKGFIAGIAYSAATSAACTAQLVLYVMLTCIICAFASVLLHYRKSGDSGNCRVFGRSVSLTAAAGASVVFEFIVSYII